MSLLSIFLHIKAALMRRSTYVVAIAVVVFIAVITSIKVPGNDNVKIGIVLNDSVKAREIINCLKADGVQDAKNAYDAENARNADSAGQFFDFVIVEDENELTSNVVNGQYECGFVFSDRFDEAFDTDRKVPLKKLIEYVHSPYTTKGEIAKERLFAEILKDYGNVVLTKDCERLFGTSSKEHDNEVSAYLLNANEEYLNSSEIFTIEFKE